MKKIISFTRRTLCMLLTLVVALSLLPANVLAAETETQYTSVHFVMPAEAEINLYRQPRLYGPMEPIPPVSETTDSGKTVVFSLDQSKDDYIYYIHQAGYATQSGRLDTFILYGHEQLEYTVTPKAVSPVDYSTYSNNFKKFEDGILLNTPDSAFLELGLSETFQIKPFRATQLVPNDTADTYYEPDYTYTVVSGNSVEVNNEGLITAKEDGVSVVRVTYDPLFVRNFNNGQGYLFNGIDKNQVGLIVINVGGSGGFDTGIDVKEFDTIYINGGVTGPDGAQISAPESTTTYTFMPPAGASVAVLHAPTNPMAGSGADIWGFTNEGNWQSASWNGSDATVALAEGRNIIRVELDGKTQYHVVRALKTGIAISNLSRPGKAATVGHTIEISFDNFSMPLPKLTKIYNPGYSLSGSTGYILYDMNGYEVQGQRSQYDLKTNHDITVTLDETGTVDFTGGTVHLTYMGFGALGVHRSVPDEGYQRGITGMAASYGPFYFSSLPDFSLKVPDSEATDEDKLFYSKLDSIFVASGNQQTAEGQEISDRNYWANSVGTTSNKRGQIQIKNIKTPAPYENYDFYWCYWLESNKDTLTAKKVVISSTDTLLTSDNTMAVSADTNIVAAQLIVTPKDKENGYPTTYSFRRQSNGLNLTADTHLAAIGVEILGAASSDFSITDGLLRAKDKAVTIDGVPTTLELGYGYLFSETDYTIAVPYSATSIRLGPQTGIEKTYKNYFNHVDVYVNGSFSQTLLGEHGTTENGNLPKIPIPQSDEITLTGKETAITLKVNQNDNLHSAVPKYPETTYTITVVRADEPVALDFSLPSGASILVKNDNQKTITPVSSGGTSYALTPGVYPCIAYGAPTVSASSFTLTIAGENGAYSITTNNENIAIDENNGVYMVSIPELLPAPSKSGSAKVNIISYNEVVRDHYTAAISSTPADLTKLENPFNKNGKPLSCVQYNHGGYTALHALIDALVATAPEQVQFACRDGKLTPTLYFDSNNHGSMSGWVCRVNGEIRDPATTVLEGGDTVDFYYNAATPHQQYAWFTQTTASVARNKPVSISLQSVDAAAANTNSATAVIDAILFVDGELWADVSSSNGTYTLSNLYDLPLGQHTIIAQKLDENNVNTLTFAAMTLTVTQSEGGGTPSEVTKQSALDAVYAEFDKYVTLSYGKTNFELLRDARDAGIAAINAEATSEGYRSARDTAISNIRSIAASIDINKALKALVPNPDGYVTMSFEDYGIRVSGEKGVDYPNQLGMLISATKVPYNSGENIGDVTLRLLEALGIKADYSYSSEYNSFYLATIQQFYTPSGKYVEKFGEFMSGSASGWMITLNNWFINLGVSHFEVENGDVIKWQNTCQTGSDIGGNNKTANLVDLVFKGKPGTLSPKFNNSTKQYIYTIPKSVTSIQIEARPESGLAATLYEVEGVTYQTYDSIPVKNGTVIKVICQYKGTGSTVLEEKSWAVTIQVQGEATVTPGKPENVVTTIAPKVTAKDGVAAVTVSASDMSTAIADAKKNDSDTIVIAPEINGKANKTSVEVPKSSLTSMGSDTNADLKIVTPTGNVTIPTDALSSVTSQADSSTITITVESVETKTLTAEQQKLVGNGAVFDISILSGGKKITSFGGKNITISLPYTLKTDEKPEGVAVWYLSDGGKLERISCKYDKDTGLATFTAAHLSNYIVGYDAWTNPFTDVSSGDWFFDAVKYATQKELFNGTSATTFGPAVEMTRAMLVTVLYRLEGKPAATGTNSFTDVKTGEWYTDAVLWASESKIVEGYGNGLFGTDDSITREQMAAILYRYAQMKGCSTTKTTDMAKYTDAATVNTWADTAMKWTVAEGLITGRTITTLTPAGTASRAEVATILMRFVESFSDELVSGSKTLFAFSPESVKQIRLQNGTTGEIKEITDKQSITEILGALNGFRYASTKALQDGWGGWSFSVEVFTNGASQAERIYVWDSIIRYGDVDYTSISTGYFTSFIEKWLP